MDLIIKNLEKLQDYHTKEGKHPIERLVLDFDKLSEMKDFTKIFEKSCEKYNEPKIKSIDECKTCKYWTLNLCDEPCHSCYVLDQDRYEPKEPTLKEATERMQSEWDATGEDVAYFMNHRIKP